MAEYFLRTMWVFKMRCQEVAQGVGREVRYIGPLEQILEQVLDRAALAGIARSGARIGENVYFCACTLIVKA